MTNIVIFKNDRTGDLITSLPAINLIIQENKDKKIIIYLSEINHKMKFLFENKQIQIKIIKYKLNIIERFKILSFFIKSNISKVYILRPKNFFFVLPIIFFYKKISFYGFCLNGKSNYKRPINFLRRFLKNFVINDRSTKQKRISRVKLQLDLVKKNQSILTEHKYIYNESKFLNNILPENYCLIHYKKQIFNELGWGINGLDKIIYQLLEYYPNVVLINDINEINDNLIFKKKYYWCDIENNKINNSDNSKILYLPNLDGIKMFTTIKKAKKVIACHGTITLLSNLVNVSILDIFYCKINNIDDFYRYKNSFHEWKPNSKNYNFTVPSSNLNKSLNKMKKFLKK